jgi:hypothetical protein
MISRRAVSFGLFTALALASGVAAAPAFAFTQTMQPVPLDGRNSGSDYHQQGSGISCFVVGASCNKGSSSSWKGNEGNRERGYPSYSGRDGNMQHGSSWQDKGTHAPVRVE